MQRKRLSYFGGLVFRDYLLRSPGIILESVVRANSPHSLVEGIRIVDHNPETFKRFTNMTGEALMLVCESDQARFRRIQREIRSVMNAPSIGCFDYCRPFRACSIDSNSFYDSDDWLMTVKFTASALVYLATFGRLYTLGILRTPQTKKRFDSMCVHEALRFMKRLGMESTPWDPGCRTAPPTISQFIIERLLGFQNK